MIFLAVDVSRVPHMLVIHASLAGSLNPNCLVDAQRSDTPKGRLIFKGN